MLLLLLLGTLYFAASYNTIIKVVPLGEGIVCFAYYPNLRNGTLIFKFLGSQFPELTNFQNTENYNLTIPSHYFSTNIM